MTCPLSERLTFVVFDWAEPRHNSITGEMYQEGFYYPTANLPTLADAEKWAKMDGTSRIYECRRDEGLNIYQAKARWTVEQVEELLSPYHRIAAQ